MPPLQNNTATKKHEKFRLIDIMGMPPDFKPVNMIPDSEIEEAFCSLLIHLNGNGIDLDVCSPNIGSRELYRFTIEELLYFETENIHVPGMIASFIYDDFYPDHKYANERTAVENCIEYFFEKGTFFACHFAKNIRFNRYSNLSLTEFKKMVLNLKAAYDKIRKTKIYADSCIIDGDNCIVSGRYEAIFSIADNNDFKEGNWSVEFVFCTDFGQWYITNIQLGVFD